MRMRGAALGLVVVGLLFGGMALPAKAVLGVEPPPAPTPGQLQALVQSFVPPTPAVVPPSVPDATDPQLPTPPFVNPPTGARPLLAAAGPVSVVSCQAAYLGPVLGIVAVTTIFDAAGVEPPVKAGFLAPLFTPVQNVCVLAPYPDISSCGPDETITAQLGDLPSPPAVGGVPTVDPFSTAPAPFASLVTALLAVQDSVNQYAYQGDNAVKVANKAAKQLTCS